MQFLAILKILYKIIFHVLIWLILFPCLFADAQTIQWQKCLGGSSAQDASSIIQTRDGGYAVAGETYSNDGDVSGNHGDYDAWVVKLDNSGNVQWQKCYGGSNHDDARSIIQTFEGGYIFARVTISN